MLRTLMRVVGMKTVRIPVVGFLLGLLFHCQNQFKIDDELFWFCGGLVKPLEGGNYCHSWNLYLYSVLRI